MVSEISKETEVVVIGGGATGTSVLRDLSLRGISTLLVEQQDLAYGTSSRFHGLLHSGGRYAVKDPESARECIAENRILHRIAPHCLEKTGGWFVRLAHEDPEYSRTWQKACSAAGIAITQVEPSLLHAEEPELTTGVAEAFRVPDAAVDGFRLCWQTARSAQESGGKFLNYHAVTEILQAGGRITGVRLRNRWTGETSHVACRAIINATGSWVGELAKLAGLDISVKPDRGTLIVFNHRFAKGIVNRLRPPGDGDIFVPHGSVLILGTTSVAAAGPSDLAPTSGEVKTLLDVGQEFFPRLGRYRLLRTFAGTRPLVGGGAAGRGASRTFVVIDHGHEGLHGFFSVTGGKLTTCRLMAEKTVDAVAAFLHNDVPCRTASELLLPEDPAEQKERARRIFPAWGQAAEARLAGMLQPVLARIDAHPEEGNLVCECEGVTRAEVAQIVADPSTFTLDDLRRKTRMGMGTCQGSFCGFRGFEAAVEARLQQKKNQDPAALLKDFLQARWHGVRPLLWGTQLQEMELTRGIYGATLNLRGGDPDAQE